MYFSTNPSRSVNWYCHVEGPTIMEKVGGTLDSRLLSRICDWDWKWGVAWFDRKQRYMLLSMLGDLAKLQGHSQSGRGRQVAWAPPVRSSAPSKLPQNEMTLYTGVYGKWPFWVLVSPLWAPPPPFLAALLFWKVWLGSILHLHWGDFLWL